MLLKDYLIISPPILSYNPQNQLMDFNFSFKNNSSFDEKKYLEIVNRIRDFHDFLEEKSFFKSKVTREKNPDLDEIIFKFLVPRFDDLNTLDQVLNSFYIVEENRGIFRFVSSFKYEVFDSQDFNQNFSEIIQAHKTIFRINLFDFPDFVYSAVDIGNYILADECLSEEEYELMQRVRSWESWLKISSEVDDIAKKAGAKSNIHFPLDPYQF